MNKVILIGRIGVEPKSKENYCQVRLAVDSHFTKKNGEKGKHTEWFNVVGFQDVGNNMTDHLSLGDLVKVEGRLQSSKYTDTQGMTRKSFSVITENFERVSSPEKTQGSENQAPPNYTHTRD